MAIIDYFLNESSQLTGNPSNGVDNISTHINATGKSSIRWRFEAQPELSTSFITRGSHYGTAFYGDNAYLFRLYDENDQTLLAIYCTTAGAFTVRDFCSSDASYAQTEIGKSLLTSYQRFDIKFKSDATDGYIEVYLDGELVYQRTGDTQYLEQSANVASFVYSGISGNGAYDVLFANMFICDSDTDCRFIEMVANTIAGDGQDTGFSGSYSDISSLTHNDSTTMAAPPNTQHTFSLNALSSAYDTYDLIAVGVHARCRSDGKGVTVMQNLIKSVSTGDEQISSASTQSYVNYTPVREVFNTAPDGTAWDLTKYLDLEIGVVTSVPEG